LTDTADSAKWKISPNLNPPSERPPTSFAPTPTFPTTSSSCPSWASSFSAGRERNPTAELTTFLNRSIAPDYNDDAEGLVITARHALELLYERQAKILGLDLKAET
jgi:hypothetical protein